MTKIQIDKGIPPPKPNGAGQFPFADMEIGDSFYVPTRLRGSVRARVADFQARNRGKKFMTRTVEDGIRVWRVE